MGKVLIECKHLKKYFSVPKGALHAVDDVSFKIEEGTTLGVVGESGCGKSTLGRTILGLIPATEGEVLFEGENIVGKKPHELMHYRRQMQMIFQDPYSSLDPKLTVYDLIEEPLVIHKLFKNKNERRDRVMELMDIVGLDRYYINTYPHELDGGRRQRIGIARALALNPKFIVCDEPVSALDVSIQAQILNLMMERKKEMNLTYMFVTHDLSVVKHISDNILVLYMGKMVEMADSDALFENPLHPYTKALLEAIPVPNPSRRGKDMVVMKGEVTSPVNPGPGCRFAPRCPNATKECFKCMPEWKEISDGHYVACHLYDEEK